MAEPLIIGTTHTNYNCQRNINTLPFRNARVVRAWNAFRIPNGLYFKLTGKVHTHLQNLHYDAGVGRWDVLHMFNGISLSRRPWVTTFETFLPRWGDRTRDNSRWGLKQLAKPACKQLIGFSECSAAIMRMFLDENPEFREAILPKISFLHPQQKPLVQSWEDKPLSTEYVDMVFTGTDFFRKGGFESIKAAERLIRAGEPLRIHVVSTLAAFDYASKAGDAEIAEARAIIARNPGRILHYQGLPNAQVLDLYRRAHAGLLPTWADTYGYSVLESQACATPVITTDLRALPEINDASCGWVLPMPKNAWGNGVLGTEAERKAFGRLLEEQLEAAMLDAIRHPEALRQKGIASLARIHAHHSPDSRAAATEAVYRQALA